MDIFEIFGIDSGRLGLTLHLLNALKLLNTLNVLKVFDTLNIIGPCKNKNYFLQHFSRVDPQDNHRHNLHDQQCPHKHFSRHTQIKPIVL